MKDLFEREQNILENALFQLERMKNGATCSLEEYTVIINEYRRILRQLRMITKLSDKTVVSFNASRMNLLDKMYHDELTEIRNRRFLAEHFKQVLCSLACSGGILSVLMIDVDFFKRYNDTYGHSRGDDCLRTIAKSLDAGLLSPDDFVVRYGGEEFVVVLQNADEQAACAIADLIIQNIKACAIPHEKNDAASYVTVSVGATSAKAVQSLTIEDYIKTADKALYFSKKNGRNQSTFLSLE